jgi:hypothetical protein
VLLLASLWIILAGFMTLADYRREMLIEGVGGRSIFQFFVYSLPAILFGLVLFWWFGKREM